MYLCALVLKPATCCSEHSCESTCRAIRAVMNVQASSSFTPQDELTLLLPTLLSATPVSISVMAQWRVGCPNPDIIIQHVAVTG